MADRMKSFMNIKHSTHIRRFKRLPTGNDQWVFLCVLFAQFDLGKDGL